MKLFRLKKISYCLVLTFITFLVFSVLSAPVNAAESVMLEYKYKMGDKITYNVNMNGTTKMETPNNKGEAPVDVKMKIEQNVLFVNPKSGNIDIQTKILNGIAKNAEGKDEDLKNVGNTVYMTIAKSGELLGATSYDANYDPIATSMSFPQEPVTIGKTWTTAIKQPIAMNVTYKMKEITKYKGRKCAVIEQETSVGPEVKNVKAKVTGKIYFDLDKGYVVMNETVSEMVMNQELENDSPNLGPSTKPVKTTVNLKVKMELAE